MDKNKENRPAKRREFGIQIRGTLNLANWLLYAVSFVFPRRRNLWVFGTAEDGFFDNSIYFFQHVSRNRPDIDAVWITGREELFWRLRDLGFRVARRRSFLGIWICLRASHYFINHYLPDVHFFTSGGAKVVNFWHGIPLKKIEFDTDSGPNTSFWQSPTRRNRWIDRPDLYRRPDFVASTSRHVSEYSFQSAFRVKRGQCLDLGYPRLDALFETFDELLHRLLDRGDWRLAQTLQRLHGHRVVLYMPTWRNTGGDYLVESGLDGNALEAFCERNNVDFVIKLHPTAPRSSWEESARPDSRVIFIRENWDAYPLMALASILVTDYSSALFDFLLTGRPIVLFPFDLEDYLSRCRSIYFDYREVMWGPVARTAADLLKSLQGVLEGRVSRGYTDADVARFHDHREKGACERYADFFAGPPKPEWSKESVESRSVCEKSAREESLGAGSAVQVPIWSVMIPVASGTDHLAETLKSVLSQDMGAGRMQIVVVVSGEVGAGLEAEVLKLGFGRIAVRREPSDASRVCLWTACVEGASGEWLHILPAGDEVLPGFYGECEKVIRRHPGVSGVWGRSIFVDERGVWRAATQSWPAKDSLVRDAYSFLASGKRVEASGVVLSREACLAAGRFDMDLPRVAEWDLWIRLAKTGKIGWVNQALSICRPQGLDESLVREILTSLQKTMKLEENEEIRKKIWKEGRAALLDVAARHLRELLMVGHYRLAMRFAAMIAKDVEWMRGVSFVLMVLRRRLVDLIGG